MTSDMRRQKEIVERLRRGVVEFDEALVVRTAREAVEAGVSAYDAALEGLAAGLEDAGELYDEWEYFLPELYNCAEAARRGLDILQPEVDPADRPDIGPGVLFLPRPQDKLEKLADRIVRQAFLTAGFEVYYLDQPLEGVELGDAKIAAVPWAWGVQAEEVERVQAFCLNSSPRVCVMVGDNPPRREYVSAPQAGTGIPGARLSPVREAIRMVSALRVVVGA